METKTFSFEVENINGKIVFTPEILLIDKRMSLIRIKSDDPIDAILKQYSYCGIPVKTTEHFSAYGFPNTLHDSELFDVSGKSVAHIKDLTDFNFEQLTDGSKIRVVLFQALITNLKASYPPYK